MLSELTVGPKIDPTLFFVRRSQMCKEESHPQLSKICGSSGRYFKANILLECPGCCQSAGSN